MINNNKSKIIPGDIKYCIDELLEKQLFNANRYYAESNPNISELMDIEKRKPSIEFLNELKERWNWHNRFYEELFEEAFEEIFCSDIQYFSPKQLEELIQIYKTCCLVDEATLVTSGAIKKHLEHQMSHISVSSEDVKDVEARFMLLTPPLETFFAQYQIDHLSYVMMLKEDAKKAQDFKAYLLDKYHANDEMVFKGRFAKKFADKLDSSPEELARDINAYKISDEYKIKHFYFTLEHPDRKAFTDLIIYDNVYEKFIASQLVGISGFLFRRKILEYLDKSGKLPNSGYIYEFSNETVIGALTDVLEERKVNMEKDVRPYKQRGMTCAIACMLMVLEYNKIIPKADWVYERKYFNSYRSRYMEGTPFSALAWHTAKNGLDTEIMHSEKNIFNNSEQWLPDIVFEKAMEEYSRFLEGAKNKGATVTNGCDINCGILKQKLEDDKLVILAGQSGPYLHAILLCGYEDAKFIVCDPLYKQKQTRTFEEIDDFMTTPLGKWCVVVGGRKLNKDILMENISEYQEVAKSKLKVGATSEKNNNENNHQLRKIKE